MSDQERYVNAGECLSCSESGAKKKRGMKTNVMPGFGVRVFFMRFAFGFFFHVHYNEMSVSTACCFLFCVFLLPWLKFC